MRKLIRVTREDIRRGAASGKTCPIARAVSRVLGEAVFVTPWALFPEATPWQTTNLPTRAVKFVRAFDNHRPVKPFNFYLEVPK